MKLLRQFITVILLALTTVSASAVSKFDRGLSINNDAVFMPKGALFFGAQFAYHNFDLSNYQILVANDLKLNAYTLKATPYLFFSVANNQAVGVKFSYKRNMVDFGNVNLELTEDMSFGLSNVFAIQHTYDFAVAYRYYIPFKGSKLFAIFADMELEGGIGQGKNYSGTENSASGAYTTSWNAGVDVAPGVSLFLTNCTAIEVSVGLLGVNYSSRSQIQNQVEKGSWTSLGGHLSIDFLSVKLGVTIALPTK